MKKFKYFLLPIFMFSSTLGANEIVFQTQTNQTSEQKKIIKKENPNNHPMINYDNGNSHNGLGSRSSFEIDETADVSLLRVLSFSTSLVLNEGVTGGELSDVLEYSYFTLYDVTDGDLKPLETISKPYEYDEDHDRIDLAGVDGWETNLVMVFYGGSRNSFQFTVPLQEFHQYRVGFNVNKGDDLVAFSDPIELTRVKVNNFEISTTNTEMIFEWDFAREVNSIAFDFKEVYAKINGKRYLLGNDATGTKTISDLKIKTEYSVQFGYTATKIMSPTKQYDISDEGKFLVSTSLPQNFSKTTIILSLVLLIILLIIFLILLGIILYWNNQRKKVTGLALVLNEDNTYETDNYYDNSYVEEPNHDYAYQFANDYQEIDEYYDGVEQSVEEWNYE